MFVKGKVEFRYDQIILNMFVKGKVDFRMLGSDMSKYDFEYFCQSKSWL
jgi:hypothetical protein